MPGRVYLLVSLKFFEQYFELCKAQLLKNTSYLLLLNKLLLDPLTELTKQKKRGGGFMFV